MTGIDLPHFHSGKVRDTYEIPGFPDALLTVATDRISTHNVKHKTLVAQKGELLTALTIFWTFDVLKDIQTHLLAYGEAIYDYVPRQLDAPDLHHRAIVIRRMRPDPREFIWRNYRTGSLEAAMRGGQDPYGLYLPTDLPKMYHFAPAVFTPTRKSANDMPVHSGRARKQYPVQTELTAKAFRLMDAYLHDRGITLVDGKMETAGDTLIDEWGTGDCCRMAYAKDVQEGVDPPWLDKEAFRQAAMRLWDGGPHVALEFPDDVVKAGIRRYHEAFEAITGMTLAQFQAEYLDARPGANAVRRFVATPAS